MLRCEECGERFHGWDGYHLHLWEHELEEQQAVIDALRELL